MDKIQHLENELQKYEAQLIHLSSEFAATKSGSAYGVEYFDIQCRVYQAMIADIKQELFKLKGQKG